MQETPHIKAIIFDCFGVLVGRGFWNVYRQAGGDPVADSGYIDHYLNLANMGQISQQDFRQAMADKLHITVDEYLDVYNKDEVPNMDVFDYIKNELKPKYKIGLLSNANAGVIERRIPEGLRQLFDDIVVSAEVGLLKPDPEIYKLAARRLGIKPSEAIFTDDHDRYLPGAKEAGMTPVLYTGLGSLVQVISKL